MCQRRKFNKKGFTLIELIVVIAIIGVLSAILVPSYFKYVEQTKITADKQDAKNMNTVLQLYFAEGNSVDVDASDIRYIINELGQNRYSFVPRSAYLGYSFWYNVETKEIELIQNKINDGVSNPSVSNNSVYLSYSSASTTIEEIVPGYLLLDVGGSELAEEIYSLRNLNEIGLFDKLMRSDSAISKYNLRNHISLFNPNNTLYVNNNVGLTNIGVDELVPENRLKIVFADNIKVLSFNSIPINNLPNQVKLPVSLINIESGALSHIKTPTKLNLNNAVSNITIERGALSDILKNINTNLPAEVEPDYPKLDIKYQFSDEFTEVNGGSKTTIKYKTFKNVKYNRNSSLIPSSTNIDVINRLRNNVVTYTIIESNRNGIVAKKTIGYLIDVQVDYEYTGQNPETDYLSVSRIYFNIPFNLLPEEMKFKVLFQKEGETEGETQTQELELEYDSSLSYITVYDLKNDININLFTGYRVTKGSKDNVELHTYYLNFTIQGSINDEVVFEKSIEKDLRHQLMLK